MGRAPKITPKKLAEKLTQIRRALGVKTLEEFIVLLDCPQANLYPSSIYFYEQGKREPPLIVLLRYARLAGVAVDVLIDDELDLP